MMRWTYLVPRLIIVGLIGLVVWLSIDPLLRKAMIYHAEAVTGAKVEVAHLRSSLEQGKVFLSEVQIADPRNPDKNLFQADMAYLDLDMSALWRRQLRILGGRTSDIRFGSPRTESGKLERPMTVAQADPATIAAQPESPSDESSATNTKTDTDTIRSIEEIESAWLDDLQAQIGSGTPANEATVTEANRLSEYWPSQFLEPRQQLQQLSDRIASLSQTMDSESNNPLRRDFASVLEEVDQLRQQTNQLQTNLKSLQQASQADVRELSVARQRDLQSAQKTESTSFDADTISQLLLAKSQRAHVDDIIRWFRWFRNSVPDFQQDFQTSCQRGVNIVPADGAVTPGFVIETLDLEGAGHFANQYLNFAGSVKNFSSAPHLHSMPVEFELRAQGQQHFVINCSIDRRSNQFIDTLAVRCPNLQIVPQPLGSERSLLVTVGPELKMQADVNLQANGDQIVGRLVFRHSNVSLHVDHLHDLAGGTDLALRMNHELSSCDQFETQVLVSGTLDHYTIKMQSDLGNKFAESMNRITQDTLHQQVAGRLQQLQQASDTQIAELKRSIESQLQELTAELQVADRWLDQTQESISSTAKSAWPDIR